MTGAQVFLAVVAVIALAACLRRGPATARRAVADTGISLVKILPIFAVALPMAAFLAALIPTDAAMTWIGPESGMTGILIASLAGGLLPGGPFVTFPLVLAFAKAGAGVPQMAALITGWSVFALHRIITWEYPLLGWRFVALRLIAAAPLPMLAGLLAEAAVALVPIGLGRP
jgi:uncharacterized membrane protein YraQ (UPF0718 family)